MPEPNQAMLIAMTAAFLLSLAALFLLFQRHIEGKHLLAYESRRRVPWGPFAAMAPILFLGSSTLLAALSTDHTEITAADFMASGWINSALMLGFVVLMMAFLAVVADADARDLGLPESTPQLVRDVGIGMIASLASLAPVYMVQYVLFVVFKPEQQHELIEQLLEHRSPQMMLVGIVMAVVAAPVFEEFTFRVLLQGWLERVEDKFIGYRSSERKQNDLVTSESEEDRNAKSTGPTIAYDCPPVNGASIKPTGAESDDDALPEHGMIDTLPHGWTPILISGFVFGLAHIGHGVAPVPLVVFGIVLGYLYQRTHRLAPSVVAHMLFNAYSMGLLWLQIG